MVNSLPFVMPHVIQATPEIVQQHIDTATTPVLLDFTAAWCGPCKGMAPALEAFAEEKLGALHVLKVDIDENPRDTSRFMVRALPTLVLLQDGKVLATKSGAMSKAQLDDFVNRGLGI